MNTSSKNNSLFCRKISRLFPINKKISVFNRLLFKHHSFFRGYSKKFNRSSFKRINDACSMKICFRIWGEFLLNFVQKLEIILIWPWIKERKVYFFWRCKGMFKGPFYPSFIKNLQLSFFYTISFVLTGLLILFQSGDDYSLKTGTNPSYNSLDFIILIHTWFCIFLIVKLTVVLAWTPFIEK